MLTLQTQNNNQFNSELAELSIYLFIFYCFVRLRLLALTAVHYLP